MAVGVFVSVFNSSETVHWVSSGTNKQHHVEKTFIKIKLDKILKILKIKNVIWLAAAFIIRPIFHLDRLKGWNNNRWILQLSLQRNQIHSF